MSPVLVQLLQLIKQFRTWIASGWVTIEYPDQVRFAFRLKKKKKHNTGYIFLRIISDLGAHKMWIVKHISDFTINFVIHYLFLLPF